MGRPESPVDRTDPDRSALAVLLRRARGRAALTYRELAHRTGISAATLQRAAAGRRVPTLATVTGLLTACGATQEDVAAATALRRRACEKPSGVPTREVIEPARLFTQRELNGALVSLHRNAGSPPYRQMQRKSGGVWLAPSSIWGILRRQKLPVSPGQMVAFLLGCDVAQVHQQPWLDAWSRVRRPCPVHPSAPYGSHAASRTYAAACLPRITRRGTNMLHHRPVAAVPASWEAVRRAGDLVALVVGASGVDTRSLARRAGLPVDPTARLLQWLRRQELVATRAGVHFPGPALELPDRSGDRLLHRALALFRDDVGAAVYLNDYTDGDVRVVHCASSESAPPAQEWVDFRAAAHASAIGKSLLAQLDNASRMDHLARHPATSLTARTITDPFALFADLDQGGPHGARFSLLEYSVEVVCAAVPLGVPGQVSSLALSLPARQHPRLLTAAQRLPELVPDLLLAALLSSPPPAARHRSARAADRPVTADR
ncbi:IclR family transcriptional regulator C-terminal domain-containing protein [Streptomyces sp. W1SF4]|uniref:IclR family transcriptional regulator domain-containing protein n=1 Tax=Streptomyces sp. W1SF4 TaxID=2305220 RepID=UPI000F6E8811|nr:IclR family transcriptional regulator C-terminal domain-containing protein [Streptomyces sp. W1SF4]AZM92783.1 helix-turn-helix domain-containing protein [Streptomyces sp. W1SF4]